MFKYFKISTPSLETAQTRLENTQHWPHFFFNIFNNSRKNKGQAF